ncbi:MAG: putative Ig domain-containing protein, partial [Magnetococcales bacterium]|nr:putative Ig domain-containing protein [Magnetococcales bacterium]
MSFSAHVLLADGTTAPLPGWLHFDAGSRTFSGVPDLSNARWNVQVRATDLSGATADSNVFTIQVLHTNHAPVLVQSLSGSVVQANQGQPFTFQFAGTTFADGDSGDLLRYEATSLTGGALPAWLRFDSDTRTFSGRPDNADVGNLDIKLVAIDPSGAKAFDTFPITVANVNDAPTGTVTIHGTAIQNSLLTASNTLADLDGLGRVGYQWQISADGTSNWSTLSGADSFRLTQAQVGQYLRLLASYTDGYGTVESVASGVTAAVANVNDRPTGGVTISGGVVQDGVLTASNTLADLDGIGSVGYQWQLSGDGVSQWRTVADGNTLRLTQSEIGQYIRVVGSYTDAFGTLESVASGATVAPTTTITQIAFSADTMANGGSNGDFVTRTAVQTIRGQLSAPLAVGEVVYLSVDNGSSWGVATATVGQSSWSTTKTLTSSNTLKVKVSNAAGNDGLVASQAYVWDPTAPTTTIATLALSADTAVFGGNNTDFITKIAAQTIQGSLSAPLAAGETVYVSLDNGSTWRAASGAVGQSGWSLAGQTLTGSNTLKVKVTDLAGNEGAVASQAYLLDQTAPAARGVTVLFSADSAPQGGSNNDGITRIAEQTLRGTLSAGLLAGESVHVSLDNGVTWMAATAAVGSNSWSLAGQTLVSSNILQVKVTDAAGNEGPVLSQA